MQLKLYLNSAYELKNVNWRYGELQPYAVAWIDAGAKRSTKIDVTNGENPVWNEMFTIPLPPTSHPDTAIVYIDIVHAKCSADMKPLVGSTRLSLRAALDVQGKASFLLNLERPSGRPQGTLDIQMEVLDLNLSNQQMPHVQPTPYVAQQPQPQPQPRPQLRPQPQYQARQMNRYPNNVLAGTMRPGYNPVINSPQNFRPPVGVAPQPGNGMMVPNMRPPYGPVGNPVGNQQAAALGNALCTLAFGVNPRQIGRMLGSFQRMTVSAFRPVQPVNMGMVNNTGTGLLGNNTNGGSYPYDPSAAQGYDNTAGYDAVGTSDNAGYDTGATGDAQYNTDVGYDSTGAYGDAQYGTDGGFGCDGTDLGGFDSTGGLEMGMFGDGTGVDLGGFDASGLDSGGFDASGLDC